MKIPAHRNRVASGRQVNGRTAYNVWILAGVALLQLDREYFFLPLLRLWFAPRAVWPLPGTRLCGLHRKTDAPTLIDQSARILGELHRPSIIDRQGASRYPDM
jgi:hypothetical protein